MSKKSPLLTDIGNLITRLDGLLERLNKREPSLCEKVLTTLRKSKNGLSVQDTSEKTGLSLKQIRNILHRQKSLGNVSILKRGHYIAV